MHKYTVCNRDLESPGALRRITSNKSAVNIVVFSMRFVVASIKENALASAAYGTLKTV